jgi:hypothetical protein
MAENLVGTTRVAAALVALANGTFAVTFLLYNFGVQVEGFE